jgi:hypothetical protein
MKTLHTSGQWHFRIGMSDNFCEIIGDFGTNKTIAVTPKDCFVEKNEAEANGRLIAAAPELLKELQHIVERINTVAIGSVGSHVSEAFCQALRDRAINAINKATE